MACDGPARPRAGRSTCDWLRRTKALRRAGVQAEAVRTYGHQQQWPKELEAVWPTAADVHTRKGGKPTRRRQKCRKLPFLARRKRSQVTGWAHPMGEALRWAAGAKCPSNARGPRWPPEPTKCVMCRRHAGPVPVHWAHPQAWVKSAPLVGFAEQVQDCATRRGRMRMCKYLRGRRPYLHMHRRYIHILTPGPTNMHTDMHIYIYTHAYTRSSTGSCG